MRKERASGLEKGGGQDYAAGLKEKTPEEQNAQNHGDSNDDDLNETHD